MSFARTRLHVYENGRRCARGQRAAASLHCHTYHSRELLNFIPQYAAQLPILAGLFQREMARYERKKGHRIDFNQAWWTPPVSPRQVLEDERLQIERRLGLPALVSITDHDEIESGLHLQLIDQRTPVSLEWTVPYGPGFFHLGVHNLPREWATDLARELRNYTEQASDALSLRALLALLNESPETLVVLNHPLWDIEFIGQQRHEECLRSFLAEHGASLHAFEVNGFRSWQENKAVLQMAEDYGVPVVSGGDRHGCQANTMLNLTRAGSFAELVAEIREDAHSEILLLPEYGQSRVARTLESIADVIRHNPHHPQGRALWTERIFVSLPGAPAQTSEAARCVNPLSAYWPNGGPAWVRAALWLVRMMGSRELQPALRLALSAERISYEA